MYAVYGGNVEKNPVTRAAIAAVKQREREQRNKHMLEQAGHPTAQQNEQRPACMPARTPSEQISQDIDMIAVVYQLNLSDLIRPTFKTGRKHYFIRARDAAMWMLWYTRSMPIAQIGRLLLLDERTAKTGIGRHMEQIGFDHPIRETFRRRKIENRNTQRRIAALAKQN